MINYNNFRRSMKREWTTNKMTKADNLLGFEEFCESFL